MSWLRLDDGFTHHPKFAGWTKEQRWNWLEVLEYCARYQTGGRIPNDLGLLEQKRPRTLLERAEKSGWIEWRTNQEGKAERWVHDWQKYNPSSAQDHGKAARQAKWREKRRLRETRLRDVSGDVSVDASLTRARFPVPSPKDLTLAVSEEAKDARDDDDEQPEFEIPKNFTPPTLRDM